MRNAASSLLYCLCVIVLSLLALLLKDFQCSNDILKLFVELRNLCLYCLLLLFSGHQCCFVVYCFSIVQFTLYHAFPSLFVASSEAPSMLLAVLHRYSNDEQCPIDDSSCRLCLQ